MRILLTNDDGIHAPGLRALHNAVQSVGEVFVFAPTTEQSGVAHSITLLTPLRAHRLKTPGGLEGMAVDGAPVDCVRLAVKELVDPPPDVVISGINIGANEGLNAFYSGTVAGALEGGLLGVPSMAVSLEYTDSPHFDVAGEWTLRALDLLRRITSPRAPVLNVNIPALPAEKIKGLRITRQGLYGADEGYEHREDPRGGSYYWIRPDTDRSRAEPGDDVHALHEGYVTVTPLQRDLTDHDLLNSLRDLQGEGGAPA